MKSGFLCFNESSHTFIPCFSSLNQSFFIYLLSIHLSLDLFCCSFAKLLKQRFNSFIFILPCLIIKQFIALHFFSLSIALATAHKPRQSIVLFSFTFFSPYLLLYLFLYERAFCCFPTLSLRFILVTLPLPLTKF